MKRNLLKIALVGSMMIGGVACTKLDPNIYDQTVEFWQTPEQIAAGIAPAYAELRGFPSGDIFSLQEVSSDEIIVPTRGSDWYDNGDWQQIWLHTWTVNHGFINGAWGYIYGGIARVNLIMQQVSQLDPVPADIENINAELKTIRAFYYYQALDLFGKVPIVENYEADLSTVVNKPREEVFTFIENELKANAELLTENVDGTTYGRMNKWFAYSLLAKLYLNAQVYTGTPRWQDCIDACAKVINSGKYSLEGNFLDNFKIANEGSKENIFVIPFDANKGLGGLNFQMRTLHYQSNETFNLAASPWNGFCTTADFYNQFSPNDTRRNMFLVGQQYSKSGAPLLDKQVNLPLIFDPEVPTISSNAAQFRMAGARSVKYEPTPNTGGDMSNDYAVFRLADIILMKAEAELRNGSAAVALNTINMPIAISIRQRAGLDNFTSITLDEILAERARELAWEGWRRNDLIRFGKFNDARDPDKAVSPAFRRLFPIPKAQLDRNSNLTQNEGY